MLICALPIIGRTVGPPAAKKQERRFLNLGGAAALKTSARFAAGQGYAAGQGVQRSKGVRLSKGVLCLKLRRPGARWDARRG